MRTQELLPLLTGSIGLLLYGYPPSNFFPRKTVSVEFQ